MPDFNEMKVIPLCGGVCCLLAVIFACVSLPMSFKTMEQGKFAVKLHWLSQQLDSKVETQPGMKMVGMGNMLLEYPSTFQTMYFVSDHSRKGIQGGGAEIIRGPIRARTQDGLEMQLSVSFQWKLTAASLLPLYEILGDHLYKDEFVRFARSALVQAASQFGAYTYFTNRTSITVEMLDVISSAFDKSDKKLNAEIKGLQLREVDLPDAFDAEIALTQEQMQEVQVAAAEREEQRIAMEREMLVATRKVEEVLETARGEATSILERNEAIVEQILVAAKEQAFANAKILEGYRDDPNPYERLFEIMEIRAVNDHEQSKLMVNM